MSTYLNGFVPDSLKIIVAQSTEENPAFAGLLDPSKQVEYAATFELLQNPMLTKSVGFRYRFDKFIGNVDPELIELYDEIEARRDEMIRGAKLRNRQVRPSILGYINGALARLRDMIFSGQSSKSLNLEKGNGTGERFVYDAACDSDLPGKEYRTETKNPAKADEDLDKLFVMMGQVRKVLLEVLGKNSLDGKGMRIKASGHYSNTGNKRKCEYDNAFWNGYMFVCGNASRKVFMTFVLLSVVAHEMGHGFENMTLPSWNNDYYGEQGARMEAFGDFIAILVALVSNNWDIATGAKEGAFQIGKGIFMPQVQGYCLRDPAIPYEADESKKEYEYKDLVIGKSHQTRHMKEIYHGESDRGGVHWNATIFTRLFYLWCMMSGGDIRKFARVWYNGHARMRSSYNFQQGIEAIGSVCSNSEKELYPNLRAAANEVGLVLPGNATILVP